VTTVPLPDPADEADAFFWRALRDGELRIQQCTECHVYRHPPRVACAHCGAAGVAWAVAAGTGEVWSYTIVHHPTLPGFADRVPYGAVVVRLDEGVFLVSNVVDCPPDELVVGTRVELAPTRVVAGSETGDDGVLPLFRRIPTG
jgi:uncharacterized OB-fold protein